MGTTLTGLTSGKAYTLYRYEGTAALPTDSTAKQTGYVAKTDFTASGATWVFKDTKGIASDTATYYRAFAQ